MRAINVPNPVHINDQIKESKLAGDKIHGRYYSDSGISIVCK